MKEFVYLLLIIFLALLIKETKEPSNILPDGREVKATLKLADNTFINNAPSGRSWINYRVVGAAFYEVGDTLIIDDSRTNQMTYYGNWTISQLDITEPIEGGNCNCSFSKTANDSLVFKFTDAFSLEWWGEKMPHHGIADIYLDGEKQATIDTYSPDPVAPALNWKIENLNTDLVHTFKMVVTGNKNTLSSGAYVVNHFFKLIKEEGIIPPPPPDPDVITDTIRVADLNIRIVRQGRYQVFIDGVQSEGEHNELEKAIEHAIHDKALNQNKTVTIKPPNWVIRLE